MKDSPQKKKDQEKTDSESAFAGLSDIAQDFYGNRSTEMFHGITEIYEESEEELEVPETETEEDQFQDKIEYLN